MNYKKIYTENYFNGNDTFFYSLGYGRYQKFYFDNLFKPLNPIIKQMNRAKVLDIGCAYGYMLNKFPKNYEKFGLDVSEYAINVARKKIQNATLKVGSIEGKLIFPKNTFDLIILNDVIEHLKYPKNALKNIKKLLKKEGILYITTPNLNWLRKKLFGFADKKEHHISLFSHSKLKELLVKTGFEIKKNYTYSSLTYFFFIKYHQKLGLESAFICKNI